MYEKILFFAKKLKRDKKKHKKYVDKISFFNKKQVLL